MAAGVENIVLNYGTSEVPGNLKLYDGFFVQITIPDQVKTLMKIDHGKCAFFHQTSKMGMGDFVEFFKGLKQAQKWT